MPSPEVDGPAPGTPQWWAARQDRAAPPPRRGRPARSPEPIVDAAVLLVDEVGADAFGMRLLAERLGTGTATLYRHFTGKEEIAVLVVDRLFAAVAAIGATGVESGEARRPETWQDAAREICGRFLRALADHPNVLPLLVSQVPVGPNALLVRERAVATLVGFGFPPRLAARAYTTLAHYVIGFAVQQYAPGSPGPAESAALGDYFRALDPEVYPCTVAAADALTSVSVEDEFMEGLRFVLAGIESARMWAANT
ncbi:TetR/AcrR family transcriptional regulator [Streptomyces sp. NPDC101175]|uniref:TetR/AcrR family transcriptional regulator n=1 Tax=Streptomyces sp. NPDC101175 TaxID=3366123 RepID=UPI0038324BD0